MYDRFLDILLESSAKRKAEIAAILARRSGVNPAGRRPGQFGAGAGVGRADQLAAIAQRNKPSQGGFSASRTAELQRQQDYQRNQVSQANARRNSDDEDEDDNKKTNFELARSQFRNKLSSMLSKGSNLTKVSTPKSVY
jgi:hypothetical protein